MFMRKKRQIGPIFVRPHSTFEAVAVGTNRPGSGHAEFGIFEKYLENMKNMIYFKNIAKFPIALRAK